MRISRRHLLAALPGMGLAGCAAPDRWPIGTTPPPDEWFPMADGAWLPVRIWRPMNRPRAVILALHGFNDSRDAWADPAPAMTGAGMLIYAPDQRGFGAAPGRGRWPGTPALVRDAGTALRLLRARHPGQRLILMGESMGGAVAMLASAHAAPDARPDGTVLLSPAVWGRAVMNPAYVATLSVAATLAPHMTLTGREAPYRIRASDNRAALIRLVEDPLTLRASTVQALQGLVDLMGAALAAGPAMPAECLFLYGARDQLVPAHAMARLWRGLPPGPRTALYADGYHLLLRDHARWIPTRDIIAWINDPAAPLPSAAGIAAAAWLAGAPE